MIYAVLALLLLGLGAMPNASAQDTRNVTEPRYPTICKILYADLTPHNGMLADDALERHYRDNSRIEKAMNSCPEGQSIVLHSSKTGKSVFLIGPLRVRSGITLVIDQSAAIWASRDPRNYDITPGSCGILADKPDGCQPLLLAEDSAHTAIMGDGIIDGRGGARMLVPHGQPSPTWWELDQASRNDGRERAAPQLLIVRRSSDFTLYNLTLRNAPAEHVSVAKTNGFTAWAVRIDTPRTTRDTAGLVLLGGSTNLSLIGSSIRTGDDAMTLKAGINGTLNHISVRDLHLYEGRGITLGRDIASGLGDLQIDSLTIDGAAYGMRIRSDPTRGGLVSGVHLDNVCMRAVATPFAIASGVPAGIAPPRDSLRPPVYSDLQLRNVHTTNGGRLTFAGLDAAHRMELALDNVVIDGLKKGDVTARFAVISVKQGNVEPSGEDVRITGAPGGGTPQSCYNRFAGFPVNTVSPVSAEVVPQTDPAIYVGADGNSDYSTIQAALKRLPAAGGTLVIAPGTYRERLVIKDNHVTLRGAGEDARRIVITADAGVQPAGAPKAVSTVRVTGDDFLAQNLTFSSEGEANKRSVGEGSGIALALAGDRNILSNVRVLGVSSALYAGARGCALASGNPCEVARTYITRAYIAASASVLVGDGLVYCDDCELHVNEGDTNEPVAAAQGKHYAAQESGFVFRNTRLTADPIVPKFLLGRPWRDLASVVYLNPQISLQIDPQGFADSKAGVTPRHVDTAYFRIYHPTGPGAPTQAKQLTPQEAGHYTPREMLAGKDGWDPSHGR